LRENPLASYFSHGQQSRNSSLHAGVSGKNQDGLRKRLDAAAYSGTHQSESVDMSLHEV